MSVLLLVLLFGAKAARGEVPNVIFALIDDASPDMFWLPESSAEFQSTRYRIPEAKHVKRMRDEGIALTAWAPSLCLPSRVSILTGKYPSTTGAIHNSVHHAATACDHDDIFPQKIKENKDIKTAMIGKWGAGPCSQGVPGTFKSWHWDEYHVWNAGGHGNNNNCILDPPGIGPMTSRFWRPCIEQKRIKTEPRILNTTENDFGPYMETEFALNFLDRQYSTHEYPFFLYWGLTLVHETEARTMPSLERKTENDETRHRLTMPESEWQRRMIAALEYLDTKVVAQLLATVEKAASAPTILWLMSDNGAAYTGKGRGVERGVHVLSVVWSNSDKFVVSRKEFPLTDSTDVAPTICDWLGVPIPRGTEGVSLAPYMSGKTMNQPRQYIFSEIGGSRLLRFSHGVLLEAANELLGMKQGRLYISEAHGNGTCILDQCRRCGPTVLSSSSSGDNRDCLEARRAVDTVLAQKRPFLKFDQVPAAFIDFIGNSRDEHLYSHPRYRSKDESLALPEDLSFKECPHWLVDRLKDSRADIASLWAPKSPARLCSTPANALAGTVNKKFQEEVRFAVVMAEGRTGSTWLTEMLNAHPNVTCLEEELADESILGMHEERKRDNLHTFYENKKIPLGLPPRSAIFHTDRPHYAPPGAEIQTYARGAKFKYNTLRKGQHLEWLASRGVRIICLQRANFAEMAIAKATGDAHQDVCNTHVYHGASDTCQKFSLLNATQDALWQDGRSPNSFLCRALSHLAHARDIRNHCANLKTPAFILEYNDLYCHTDQVLARLRRFLSLPDGAWSYASKTTSQKLTARTTEEIAPEAYRRYQAYLSQRPGSALISAAIKNANQCYDSDSILREPGFCLDHNAIGRPVHWMRANAVPVYRKKKV